MSDYGYTVRYVEIPAREIYNFCGPMDLPTNDRVETGRNYIKQWNNACNFYKALERSIADKGFRNPIFVNAGAVQPRMRSRLPKSINIDRTPICMDIGGSRLFIAQKHDMTIPCIVSDFKTVFPRKEILKNDTDIAKKFFNKPTEIIWTEWGVRAIHPEHIHLDDEYRSPDAIEEIRKKMRHGEYDY